MSMIDGVGRPGPPRPARKGAGAGQGAFSVPFGSGLARAGVTGVGAGSAAALDAVLVLQERTIATVQDREARRGGRISSRALSRMQRSILGGWARSGIVAGTWRCSPLTCRSRPIQDCAGRRMRSSLRARWNRPQIGLLTPKNKLPRQIIVPFVRSWRGLQAREISRARIRPETGRGGSGASASSTARLGQGTGEGTRRP